MTLYNMKYSAQYHVFPASFHVTSRKVDFFWDSAPNVIVSLRLFYGVFSLRKNELCFLNFSLCFFQLPGTKGILVQLQMRLKRAGGKEEAEWEKWQQSLRDSVYNCPISVFGRSCTVQSLFFSFSFCFFASHSALGSQPTRKRKECMGMGPKRENFMNCRKGKL